MFSAAVTVQEFAARAAVQRALKAPTTTESVLSFFFGVDYQQPAEIEVGLRQGGCLKNMSGLWYGGAPDYDALCQPFRDMVRAAGKNEFLKPSSCVAGGFPSEVDGLVAQMILCDQLPRNIFRGFPEAFAYEEQALEASRQIANSVLQPSSSALKGEVYPPYVSFATTALMHSECKQDHEHALELLHICKETSPEHLQGIWNFQQTFEEEHKAVIDRFGRYPYRNKSKGRESTPEEESWLADVDNLPGWAKSQMS
jgi:uncharacterized protein (DUF924 family)